MTFPDIRHYNNLGPFAIRDETWRDRGLTLDTRLCWVLASVLDADDEAQRVVVDNTMGDVLGFTYFENKLEASAPPEGTSSESGVPSEKTRPMPAWFPAAPVIGRAGGKVLPIRNDKYEADTRFFEKEVRDVNGRLLKEGKTAIVISATEEEGSPQDLLLGVGDADLIAVNKGSDYEQGTIVYDLDGDKLSEMYFARLQTAWRVFLRKSSPSPSIPAYKGGLAWQLGKDAEGDSCFGLCVDDVDTSELAGATGLAPMWAYMGMREGGPLWVGEKKEERHIRGSSEDGEPLASGHIHTDAIYKMPIARQKIFKRGDMFDSSLEFQEEIYDRPKPLPFHQRTHLWWDPEKTSYWCGNMVPGQWRWLTEDAVGGSRPPPGNPPPPEDPPPEGGPGDPVPQPGDGGGKTTDTHKVAAWYSPDLLSSGKIESKQDDGRFEEYRQSPLTHAFASQLLKASWTNLGAPDLRDYTKELSENDLWGWVLSAPIVGRDECYGAYPTLMNPVYTQRPRTPDSNFDAGTGAGGKVLFQPEINIADLRKAFETGTDPRQYTNEEVSPLHRVYAPLVYTAWGYPNFDDGGLYKGYRSQVNLDMDWILSNMLDDGTETNVITAPGDATADHLSFHIDSVFDQDLSLKSGTAYLGTFQHSNSANRTYTFPDVTGDVKLNTNRYHFFQASPSSSVYSLHPVNATAPTKTSYAGGYVPNDATTISAVYAVIISSATDAAVDLDWATEYGASTQDHATHTGTITTASYSLTAGRITLININAAIGSLAGGDYIGCSMLNNDAATTVNFKGLLVVEKPDY